jgi:hypothetical protein
MAILASSSVPALSADPPIAAPGYVQDSSGKVVMSGSGACWHTSDWTPAKGMYPQVPDKPQPTAAPRKATMFGIEIDTIDHSKTTEVPF